jgi:integrase
MTTPAPQRRRGLTDKMLATMRRKSKRYILADPEMRGLYVRVPPQGPIVFTVVARFKPKDEPSEQVWKVIGTTSDLTIGQARDRAREAIRRIKAGLDAVEKPKPKPESVAVVSANWLHRHVEKKQLRTAPELRRIVEKYILPYWADRDFVEIRRTDIAMLLDRIEDKHGPAMADAVLKTLRAVASWVQSRDDVYVPPFAKNMRRVDKKDRRRNRWLNDEELRAVWKAAGDAGPFGCLVRLLVLTAQRYQKILTMRWTDIADGVWTIATEPREKGNPGQLLLPPQALTIIGTLPRFASNEYLFAGRTDKPRAFGAWDKAQFDKLCGVTGWRLHDLRRTARSLMSRAGVLSEHAERVLGHAIGGVEGIYDQHDYSDEKAQALLKLAALISRITDPPAGNVVPLRGEAVS